MSSPAAHGRRCNRSLLLLCDIVVDDHSRCSRCRSRCSSLLRCDIGIAHQRAWYLLLLCDIEVTRQSSRPMPLLRASPDKCRHPESRRRHHIPMGRSRSAHTHQSRRCLIEVVCATAAPMEPHRHPMDRNSRVGPPQCKRLPPRRLDCRRPRRQ